MSKKKPDQIRMAVGLLYLALALGLMGPFIDDSFRRIPGIAILISALTAVFTVVLIEFISIGRNWARMVYFGLTILGLPFSFMSLYRHLAGDEYLLVASAVVQLVAHGIAFYWVFIGPAKWWFKPVERKPDREAVP
ncbi:hypothetical protein [Lysobacter sp. CA199]|uniref:hypothetical protein n=1 Tax=Lysobacter sp. CA199 TaxID=3455608 RepID=UPI003F8CF454